MPVGRNNKIRIFKYMKYTPLVILTLAFAACSNEKPTEVVATQAPQEVIFGTVDSVTKAFMLPDSINTGLIIATYVEIDPESHTLLVYANNDKKEAKRIRYRDSGPVTVDKLEVISENQFRSPDKKFEYVVNDSTVLFKTGTSQIAHFRTDANN
jgi:hypothetical protein